MIAFRTVNGCRVWIKPESVISIVEVKTENVEGLDVDKVKHEQVMGVTIFQHGMMWISVEEGLCLVRELARVGGDDWKVGEIVEEDAT
jgi:hypothetical protein